MSASAPPAYNPYQGGNQTGGGGGGIISVQVPPGATSGTTLQITNPQTGAPLQVQVPYGVGPGEVFQVQIPSASYAGSYQSTSGYSQPVNYQQPPKQTIIIHESDDRRRYDNGDAGLACCACAACALCDILMQF
ncbi:hypothetical protein Pmar_PMAR023345 [Perkinsus marinus ATCC 50983]|uniref:Cysteine-rich transmembrane CYSTM domain-containing protein n=1 Tax=Perkinsus marinus (strain ATCC 50983 / TXsc) TaxID=423536 RepID=C5KKA9_PERM5|nr:hypothetical protein Pmar_PMAR023345 [Perkinsus marinus ATCC 50983]EER15021.1 hypothetical protein Pmar_PMAR023345 [Perkinsus marinus ATCC 50983]|eukprot:XP_002783225.1 hypothetical protein Pmar_PMAR023345 [Perkinsus marinus ATCC 50983]